VLTYTVGGWANPSLVSNFVNYSMAAKKIEAAVPSQPAGNGTVPVVGPTKPDNKPPVTQKPPQTGVVVPEAQPDVIGGMTFVAILAAAVIVGAGIIFLVIKRRKKKKEE
jgi:hypothetical protein